MKSIYAVAIHFIFNCIKLHECCIKSYLSAILMEWLFSCLVHVMEARASVMRWLGPHSKKVLGFIRVQGLGQIDWQIGRLK